MTVACSTLFSSAKPQVIRHCEPKAWQSRFILRLVTLFFEGTSLVRRIEGFASTVIIMNLLTMKALLVKEKVCVCTAICV